MWALCSFTAFTKCTNLLCWDMFSPPQNQVYLLNVETLSLFNKLQISSTTLRWTRPAALKYLGSGSSLTETSSIALLCAASSGHQPLAEHPHVAWRDPQTKSGLPELHQAGLSTAFFPLQQPMSHTAIKPDPFGSTLNFAVLRCGEYTLENTFEVLFMHRVLLKCQSNVTKLESRKGSKLCRLDWPRLNLFVSVACFHLHYATLPFFTPFSEANLFALRVSCFNRPNDIFFPPVNIYEEVVGLVVEHFMSTQVASELKSLRSYISTQHRRSQRERERVSPWVVGFCGWSTSETRSKVKTFKEAKISYTFAQSRQWQIWSNRALDIPRAKVEHEKAAMTFRCKIQFCHTRIQTRALYSIVSHFACHLYAMTPGAEQLI